jgi:transcriptional regulator with XRE-family HTH domain
MPISVIEIGRRLAKLRKVPARDTGEDWTQARVARQLGIAPNMIYRLEYGGASIANLSKLLEFYYNQGFDTNWVMVSDNSSVRMYREVKPADQELMQTLQKLKEILNNTFP